MCYYLTYKIFILTGSSKIQQQMIGMDHVTPLMELKNKKQQVLSLPENNGIIINPAMEEDYNLHIGDFIKIQIGQKTERLKIVEIAENADSNSVYVTKIQLSNWLQLPSSAFTGVLSKEVPKKIPKGYTLTTMDKRTKQLDINNVSNKMSAVINQILGCVIGCLLIYLALLLNYQKSMKNILILGMLGYQTKEINKLPVNIYRPIVCVAFVTMAIPSILICKMIQRSLSIQTGDYMPFQTNVFVILFLFLSVNLIYSVLQYTFKAKINKIKRKELSNMYL